MVENAARDARWFEMVDVIANTYGNSTWTLLWCYDVAKTGNPNSAGYEEEIFRIRTLFAPLENKDRLLGGHFWCAYRVQTGSDMVTTVNYHTSGSL